MNRQEINNQRFMVSPDGFQSDWFDASEIADAAPGWTDCTDMSDIETNQLMVRRMNATVDENLAEQRIASFEFDRMYESGRI
jgi:hypothetical protein